jgi:hypothetical protein
MVYLLGYILACFVSIVGVCYGLEHIYSKSQLRPKLRIKKMPPSLSSRVIISFSIILPFSALAFVFMNFAAMKMAQSLARDGHTQFVIASLVLPAVCFLLGYLYFKRVVRL